MKLINDIKHWLVFKIYQSDLTAIAKGMLEGPDRIAFRRYIKSILPQIYKENGMVATTRAVADYINVMYVQAFDLTVTNYKRSDDNFDKLLIYLQSNFVVNQASKLGPIWFFRIIGKRDEIISAMQVTGKAFLLEVPQHENLHPDEKRHPDLGPLERGDGAGITA
jgi:hypothetical protein